MSWLSNLFSSSSANASARRKMTLSTRDAFSLPTSSPVTASHLDTSKRLSSMQCGFDQVLADLKHLDLCGSVEYDSPKRPVARGGFGEVYKGEYKLVEGPNMKVAIKRLTVYLDGKRDTLNIFRREIRAWSRLKHPNVLPLLGYMLEETGDPDIVSPSFVSQWMEQGHVLDFVRRNPNCNIARLAVGMADGLTYLHEQEIVHSDFKSANVLVSGSHEAVICDFGSSHITHTLSFNSSDVTGIRGTSRWIAYELLAEPEKYPRATKESDTWAFGMTVYEIMTNDHPYAHIAIEAQVLMSIFNRKLPSPPTKLREGYKNQLWDICTSCWIWEPSERPTMEMVSRLVRGIEESSHPVAERVSSVPLLSDPVMDSLVKKLWRSELPELDMTGIRMDWSPTPFRCGGISDNYVAEYPGGKVTVRQIRRYWVGASDWNKVVLRQMLVLSRGSHPNVEELLGYVFRAEDSFAPPALVFRFVGTEDLKDHVRNNPQCNIVQMILGVAHGLAYLHEHEIVHGDIRAANILVQEGKIPVISELFYTDQLSRDNSSAAALVPSIRWTAFEFLSGSGVTVYTRHADVWAFGMTIYELLSGNVPYNHIRRDPQVILAIACGELPPCPDTYDSWPYSRKSVWAICQKCWEKDPLARPTMDKLVGAFEGVLAMQFVTDM